MTTKKSKSSAAVDDTKVSKTASELVIRPPDRSVIYVRIEGTGTRSLIQNAFNQKLIEQILKKHMGIREARTAKKPRELIEQAIVRNEKGVICLPPVALKKACLTVVATGAFKGLNKPKLRQAFDIEGQSIPIQFERMTPRMDVVRNANGMPDIRFRPEFRKWYADLGLIFDSNVLAAQLVLDIVQRAGSVGIGEWRPERDGKFGTFAVAEMFADAERIEKTRAGCEVPMQSPIIPDWALDADLDLETLAQLVSPTGDAEPVDVASGDGKGGKKVA